jgi:hypothetical protein
LHLQTEDDSFDYNNEHHQQQTRTSHFRQHRRYRRRFRHHRRHQTLNQRVSFSQDSTTIPTEEAQQSLVNWRERIATVLARKVSDDIRS